MRTENLYETAQNLTPPGHCLFILREHEDEVTEFLGKLGAAVSHNRWDLHAPWLDDSECMFRDPYVRIDFQFMSHNYIQSSLPALVTELVKDAKPFTCVSPMALDESNIVIARWVRGQYQPKHIDMHSHVFKRADHLAQELYERVRRGHEVHQFIDAIMQEAQPVYDSPWEGQLRAYQRDKLNDIIATTYK